MIGPGGFEGMKDVLTALALLSAPALVLVLYGTRGPGGEGADVVRPLAAIEEGRVAFADACARCHGRLGRGGTGGPSLVTPALRALPDAALREAIRGHVRALSEPLLDDIVAYLRERQRIEAAR